MKRMIKALSLLLGLVFLAGCASGWREPEHEPSDNMDIPLVSASTGDAEASIVDYDQFFQDNPGYYVKAKNGLDDSGMVLGNSFRAFDSSALSLVSDGMLPEIDGFPTPAIWVKYNEDRRAETAYVSWTISGTDGYVDRYLGFYVWVEKPDSTDPYYRQYIEGCYTSTDIGDATVIGAGKTDTPKLLWLPLTDGAYCQIEANEDVTSAEMGVVLDFLIGHGFNFSRFDYEAGEPLPNA